MIDPHRIKDEEELKLEVDLRQKACDIIMKTNEWVLVLGSEIIFGFDDGDVAENVVVGYAEKIRQGRSKPCSY